MTYDDEVEYHCAVTNAYGHIRNAIHHSIGLLALADQYFQPRLFAWLAGDDVLLGEDGHENLLFFCAIAVINDEDSPVVGLHAVRITDSTTLVQQEFAGPGAAVVVGQQGGESFPFVGLTVFDQ